MAFVLDGREWCFDGWSSQAIESAIEEVLARLGQITARGERFWIGDDFQNRPMLGALSLWQLWAEDSSVTISRDVRNELTAYLIRAQRYADEDWPDRFDEMMPVSINGGPETTNLDILWIHLKAMSGAAIGCLGISRSGIYRVDSAVGTNSLYWIGNDALHVDFWRRAIAIQGGGAETLQRLAPHAFPNLYFAEGVWRGCNDFGGGYISQEAALLRYLAALDDHGYWVYEAAPPAEDRPPCQTEHRIHASMAKPSNQLIERRFRRLNLEIAPENPDVQADRQCREARQVIVKGCILYCEWHAKLEAHRNRVHIHQPVVESDYRTVIGILHNHLPLPGRR